MIKRLPFFLFLLGACGAPTASEQGPVCSDKAPEVLQRALCDCYAARLAQNPVPADSLHAVLGPCDRLLFFQANDTLDCAEQFYRRSSAGLPMSKVTARLRDEAMRRLPATCGVDSAALDRYLASADLLRLAAIATPGPALTRKVLDARFDAAAIHFENPWYYETVRPQLAELHQKIGEIKNLTHRGGEQMYKVDTALYYVEFYDGEVAKRNRQGNFERVLTMRMYYLRRDPWVKIHQVEVQEATKRLYGFPATPPPPPIPG